MKTYYDITKALYNHLQSDTDINTVVIGNLDEIDMGKQTMFPLSHIVINNASFPRMGLTRFSILVEVMDIVDIEKNSLSELDADERWKGVDNKQDIFNTQLAVIEKLIKALENGLDIDLDLVDRGTAEPFEAKAENLLAGWDITFTVDIINTVQNC